MPSGSRRKHSGRWFAEAYVDGREFNIAVMAGEAGPFVFPLAEMRFNDEWPDGKPKLVSLRRQMGRGHVRLQRQPAPLRLRGRGAGSRPPARRDDQEVWHLFSLRGYARVDFRVDASGKPWVLEINPNCCISTDAGFAAAAEQAGISYEELIGPRGEGRAARVSVVALARAPCRDPRRPGAAQRRHEDLRAALFRPLHGMRLLRRPVLLLRRRYRRGQCAGAAGADARVRGLHRRAEERMVHRRGARGCRVPFRPLPAHPHARQPLRLPSQRRAAAA